MISQFKLYASVACIALISGAALHYNHLISSNKQLRSDLSAKTAELEQSQGLLAKERQSAQETALRAQKYFEQRAKDDEELERLRACYADRTCWPRVRVKTSCPAMPSTATNAGALEESTAELGENAGRNLLLLRQQIKEITTGYIALQHELAARSAPDYCHPK